MLLPPQPPTIRKDSALRPMSDEELRQHMVSLDDDALTRYLAQLDETENAKPLHLDRSAVYYAERLRWPVFPLKPRGKQPLTRHGFKDATRALDQIRAWWAETPDANIGTPTGPTSDGGCGFDVIDIDGIEGFRSLAQLDETEIPPLQARAWTPGGPGQHIYIDATGDGNASRYEPGLDYRGRGGYVVVPPSVGLNGKRYSWTTKPALP